MDTELDNKIQKYLQDENKNVEESKDDNKSKRPSTIADQFRMMFRLKVFLFNVNPTLRMITIMRKEFKIIKCPQSGHLTFKKIFA